MLAPVNLEANLECITDKLTLRDVLMYLWAQSVQGAAENELETPMGRLQLAAASVVNELQALGFPVVFDHGPGWPYSRQVGTVYDEIVFEPRLAPHYLVRLRYQLASDRLTELDQLLPVFKHHLLSQL